MKYCIAKAKEPFDRRKSASGGIWQVFATLSIKNGWVVYGAAFTDKLYVKHIRCTSLEEVEKTFGTKYVQSQMGDTIRQISNDLFNGSSVLFAGTPCQVAAVRRCIKNNPKLILCDIVCHGVLNNNIFGQYIKWLSDIKGEKISSFTFRDKSKGMSKQRWKATLASGKEITDADVYSYNRIFYSDKMLRESCYECKYANLERVGDITIGDLHGWSEKFTDMVTDDYGVSTVIINTELGEKFFEECNPNLEWLECNTEDIIQPQLIAPVKRINGDNEWEIYKKEGFSNLVKKYFNVSFRERIIHLLKDIKREIT